MPSFDLSPAARRPARCRILVERGALGAVPEIVCRGGAAGAVAVVADARVAPLYGARVAGEIGRAGLPVHLLTFPAGEASKSRESKARLEDRLAEAGAGRDLVVVAVGGGVTGDLAGFLAATWARGVRLVQVPTSLLAMVDAAIGGKTGVDLPAGKNLVGAFHLPEAVVIDPDTLRTLPDHEFRCGLAEIVKTAVVCDLDLFRTLERDAERLLRREPDVVDDVVLRCARRKARIVARDERDAGRRAILNFGHTVGHALEAASAYRVPHGLAVAVGMTAEAGIACARTGFPEAHRLRLVALLERLGLPTAAPVEVSTASIVASAASDKKNRAGRLRCALPSRLGRASARGLPAVVEVEADEVARAVPRRDPV